MGTTEVGMAARPLHGIALAGPTASGKTAIALSLAREFPFEIISVDSAQVYRGMDIGTAKPCAQELAQVPHHLIDIRDPLQPYSAAEFVRDASQRMADIRQRGKLALLVGGTMLYFKALMEGLDDMPPADPTIRAALEREAAAQGWPAMHAQLAQVDPASAQRLAPADSQRIQRALEVFRITGRPLSDFHLRRHRPERSAAQAPERQNIALIALEPDRRAWLHDRIAARFDAMLDAGFVAEVRQLRARPDLHPDLPSMRCVGYRQIWEALDGVYPMAQMRDRGIFATRQLAKRQITWLRSMPSRYVVAADHPHAREQTLALVSQLVRR